MRHTLPITLLLLVGCAPVFPRDGVQPYPIAMSPNDVVQGMLPDCWLMAGLMALAAHSPATLTDNIGIKDGNVVIGLYDRNGNAQWYNVDASTAWPQWFRQAMQQDGYDTNAGGSPLQLFVALGGMYQDYWLEDFDGQTIEGILKQANTTATVATSTAVVVNGIVPQHAYAVLNYSNGNVYLGNPWGVDSITLTVSQLRNNFVELDAY